MPEHRVAALAAGAFTVAFIAGGVLLGEAFGALGDPDRVFVDHYESRTGRIGDIVGASLLIVAAMALLVFAIAWRASIAQSLAAAIGGQALGGAALLLAVAGALLISTPFSMTFGRIFGDTGQFEGAHAAVLPQAGTVVILVAVYPLAALGIVAMAIAAREQRRFAAWHDAYTLATAAVMLLAFLFLPLLAFPLWTLVTAAMLWRVERKERP